MSKNKKIIVFTGPSLLPNEANKILEADYRPPVSRGDVTNALKDKPDMIIIIDGLFHQKPAVSHKEILEAINNNVIVVGGASMGALRAAELDDLGMIGVGQVYRDYRMGNIESDDDVAVVINPETLEQLSEALVSMNYNFKAAMGEGVINEAEYKILVKTAKSIYYPKRTYDKVFKESKLEIEDVKRIRKFLNENMVDIKREDAVSVLNFVKNMK
ncbi:MAG TPA: TfuA-related McrA-glycine thioamidation protein [Methanobacterium sp.]